MSYISAIADPIPVNEVNISLPSTEIEYINLNTVNKIQVFWNMDTFLSDVRVPISKIGTESKFRLVGNQKLLKFPLALADGMYGIKFWDINRELDD